MLMRAAVNTNRQLCRRCRDRVLISAIIILALHLLEVDIHSLFENTNQYYLRFLDRNFIPNKGATAFTERNQYGTWIGNNWIPPAGKKIYSAADMKLFFQKHSVLWIGDSTARRAYNTLYGILSCNETHIPNIKIDAPELLVEGKLKYNANGCVKPALGSVALCRTIPGTDPKDFKLFDYHQAYCYRDVTALAATDEIRQKIATNYSLLIVSLGVWEIANQNHCADTNNTSSSFPNSAYESLTEGLDAMCQLQGPSLTIVWRTSGFRYNDAIGNMYLEEFNDISTSHIDSFNKANIGNSNITYVDWGTEISPRSNGADRIKGDTREHYGLEARLLFLQLLMNELNPIDGHA